MYNVGQVLFIVLNQKPQIIPVKVIEQVVRRSVDGESIQYSVVVPTSNGDKTFELDELDGEVYTSISDVEHAMMDNAKSMIKQMANKASVVAGKKFDYNADPNDNLIISPDLTISSSKSNSENSMKVTLEDGVVANIRLPEEA